jgi:hypothetical protein
MNPAPMLAHVGGLGTKPFEAGTIRSQTGSRFAGSVDLEGGGTASPTQGGGCPITGRPGVAARGLAL